MTTVLVQGGGEQLSCRILYRGGAKLSSFGGVESSRVESCRVVSMKDLLQYNVLEGSMLVWVGFTLGTRMTLSGALAPRRIPK